MADEDQRVLAQLHDLEFRVTGRVGDQAQVHDVAQHVLIHLVGAAIFDVDVDGGIALEEFLEVGRQDVQADAVNGGDADVAGNDRFDFLELAVERIVGLEDLLAVNRKALPFGGETEILFAAFDEQGLEQPLESG